MKRHVDKHLPYWDLLESLQNAKVCVICEMGERSTRCYFETLLYENVNDPGLRQKLIASQGFCRRHAEVLLKCGDAFGTSILYQDQVKQALAFLSQLPMMPARSLRRKIVMGRKDRGKCLGCLIEKKNDTERTEMLLSGLHELQIAEAFEQSPGLCVPHLMQALALEKESAAREYLVEKHRRAFSVLLGELEEFCRKRDYRYSHETYGKESDAWIRTVKMLLGGVL